MDPELFIGKNSSFLKNFEALEMIVCGLSVQKRDTLEILNGLVILVAKNYGRDIIQ